MKPSAHTIVSFAKSALRITGYFFMIVGLDVSIITPFVVGLYVLVVAEGAGIIEEYFA